MSINSKIEWTHHTANLWHGCTKVHEGCDHCYAETLSKRWKRDIWGNDKPRMIITSVWNDLKKAQAMAAAAGEMQRVFVGSMMDIFEKPMPVINGKGDLLSAMQTDVGFIGDTSTDDAQLTTAHIRAKLFDLIEAGKYPNLLFLFLTKRPSNINKYIPESWKKTSPANVMFGTSPCNQETTNTLIPQLMKVKGKRFLSIEPLLGPIDLKLPHRWWDEAKERCDHCCNGDRCDDPSHRYRPECPYCRGTGNGRPFNWIIAGGESGHGARPMHPDWARSIRDQCKEADVPFFFKQWGEYLPHCQIYNSEAKIAPSARKFFPSPHNPNKTNTYYKIGKKEAGRLLDSQQYNEFPEIKIGL